MPIRVLLDASTAMVRSALKAALRECDDIEVVEASRLEPPQSNIDVVVLQQRSMRDFPAPLGSMAESARLGVVAINDDGQGGELYRIYRSGWRFAPSERGGLADAIRAVASTA
jgi:hypothetical protein